MHVRILVVYIVKKILGNMNVEMKVYPRPLYCLVPLSFLALNVCGILSKMKHTDFLSVISSHDGYLKVNLTTQTQLTCLDMWLSIKIEVI